MTREKVKLTYITNDAARRNTFRKRKKSLVKKAHELSTLCDVELCVIIYGPYEFQPEVWPSHEGVQQVLSNFNELTEIDQSRKMVNQEGFLRQRIAKAGEQLRKHCWGNHEMEMKKAMFQSLGRDGDVQGLNLMHLNEMGWMIERYLEDIHKRIDTINKATTAAAAAAASANPPAGSDHGDNVVQEDQHIGFDGNRMMLPLGNNINYKSTPWPIDFLH